MAFAWVDGTSESHAGEPPYKFLAKDLYLIIVGYAGCIFTGTLFDTAFLYPDGYWDSFVQPTYADGWRMHLRTVPRTLLSIMFQTMLWLGFWNVQENYFKGSLSRELCYMCLGLLLLRCTGALVSSSWIECPTPDWDEIQQPKP